MTDGSFGSAVDYDRARAMCNGNEGLLRKLLVHFATSVPGDLRDLESHLNAGEPEVAGRLAHRIKGQAASLAIDGVRDAALRIEEDARDGRLDDAGHSIEDLKRTVTAFCEEMKETES